MGETLQGAARREAKEETGLTITLGGLVDVIDFIERDDAGKPRYHYSLIDYWADCPDGEPAAGDDASAVKWVSLSSIDTLPLWNETKRVIHQAAKLRDKARHG